MGRWLKLLPLRLTLAVATILVSNPSSGLTQHRSTQEGEWRYYASDGHATKYSPLGQITKDNIQDLQVIWRWPSPDRTLHMSNPVLRTSRNEDTPLIANGVLYTVTGLGMIAALDPGTGQTRWLYDPVSYNIGRPSNVGFMHRGLGYWTDGKQERLLLGTADAYLISVDARTGKPDLAFGDRGKVDLTTGIHDAIRTINFHTVSAPLIAADVVVVGNTITDSPPKRAQPPGFVRGFDVRTGKLRWTFHTVPSRSTEFGWDTWLAGSAEYSGGANVWSGMSYDPELDYVYLPTSTPTNDWYGGHRLGDNLFAESVVCVEAKTGRRVWHFQAVHHGLWDYDFPTNPVLGDITVDGRRIKALIQVSKQAFTYVFDRTTGEPVWPIEERPVAQSTVPGERTSPTQPFPTKPRPFDLQGATEENLIDLTPELRKRALDQLQRFGYGPLFTPPSLKATVFLPGVLGAASWGGAGFDPETGTLYVPSRLAPSVYRLVSGDSSRTNFSYIWQSGGGGGGPLGMPTLDGLPVFKPPYARVTAIDMNKGEHSWVAPLGNGPRNHPLLKGLNVPPLGDGIQGGSVLVTKTLLFVSVTRLGINGSPSPPAWAEWGDPTADRKLIYVFDKQSGKLLREIELDGRSAAAPMTYLHDGKQYVVVAVGGGPTSELVALSLARPRN
jgi:quinoprotein glucose dehydrogenase